LQIIHNSPDPAVSVVDIYIDTDRVLRNLRYQGASWFLDIPAGTQVELGIAPGNSASSDEIFATYPLVLDEDETYVIIATGVMDASGYSSNPDGRSIDFALITTDEGLELSSDGDNMAISVFHGCMDAPALDIVYGGIATLLDNIAYSDLSSYFEVPAEVYSFDIVLSEDNSIVLGSFEADMSWYGGSAAVVFFSGFLDPAANQHGSAFGMFMALPDGTVREFPLVTSPGARLQLIHNAADPDLEFIDIYIDDVLVYDDFEFRTATPFMDVETDVEVIITIAPGNSTSSLDAIRSYPIEFEAGKSYVGIATGVLNPVGFMSNPDGEDISFEVLFTDLATESSGDPFLLNVSILQGATDVPSVDVVARGVGPILENVRYGELSAYFDVPADDYIIDLVETGGTAILASYYARFSHFGGAAAVVFSSGFLQPLVNKNGPKLGLFAALPDGFVMEFQSATTGIARLQVIHSAADPEIDVVDVYVDDIHAIDDLAFRSATPFIDIFAGAELTIGIAPANSSSVNDVFAQFPVTLSVDGWYVAIVTGVKTPSNFAENPDGMPIDLNIEFIEVTQASSDVDLTVFHGVTDAPTVDVLVRNASSIVEDLSYGNFSPFFALPAADYILDITPAGNPSVIVGFFRADLRNMDGASATVFASGFLSPGDNQNGPELGLFAALEDGTVIQLISTTSVDRNENARPSALMSMYPNPVIDQARVNYTIDRTDRIELKVYDVLGREVLSSNEGVRSAGDYSTTIVTHALSPGLYRLVLVTSTNTVATTMAVVK